MARLAASVAALASCGADAFSDARVPIARHAERHDERSVTLQERLPWYHSADDIHRSLASLAQSCQGAQLTMSNMSSPDGNVTLDTVHISRASKDSAKKTKAVFFFGIHSRELISTESGLHFAQTLCGKGPAAKRASSLLDKVDFAIVPNANPYGRKTVEKGDFCKRTNEHGVDLNRNWGLEGHSDSLQEDDGADTNPGPHSFSEPESQLLAKFVEKEKPQIFLDVHSGSYLLGTPWAYSPKAYPEDEAMLLEVLKPISEKYCKGECPYGNAADMVGYAAPGTEMDYVKEIGTPYSFSWEIYVGPKYRPVFAQKAQEQHQQAGKAAKSASLLQRDARKVYEALVDSTQDLKEEEDEASNLRGFGALRDDEDATALKTSSQARILADSTEEACIEQFAPRTEKETQEVVENWSDAYLDLCERVLNLKTAKK